MYPPFALKREALHWLAYLVEQERNEEALRMLWWQASIAPGGINEHLTKPAHWACQT